MSRHRQARTIVPDGYEVFFRSLAENAADGWIDEDGAPYPEGWYWWSCQPGCLPDGDATGAFDSRSDAIADCRGVARVLPQKEEGEPVNNFIVKEATFGGTYANPYKRGGRGMKWNKWKTVSKHQTLADAIAHAVVAAGLSKRAVFHRGGKLSDGQKILSGLSISGEVERLAVIAKEKG